MMVIKGIRQQVSKMDPWLAVICVGVILAGSVAALVLFLPHGKWKWVLLAMVAAGIFIALRNPKYRLMQMGILCITTALVGLGMSVLASLSVQQPDGSETTLEVAVKSATSEGVFLLVLVAGVAQLIFDRIYPYGWRDAPVPTDVSGLMCVPKSNEFSVAAPSTRESMLVVSVELVCTNVSEFPLSIARIECDTIEQARALFDHHGDEIFQHTEIAASETRTLFITGRLRAVAFTGAKLNCRMVLIDNRNRKVPPLELVLTRPASPVT